MTAGVFTVGRSDLDRTGVGVAPRTPARAADLGGVRANVFGLLRHMRVDGGRAHPWYGSDPTNKRQAAEISHACQKISDCRRAHPLPSKGTPPALGSHTQIL
jgi:hypothetical protein